MPGLENSVALNFIDGVGVQLPNGDIWKGMPKAGQERPDNVDGTIVTLGASSADEALAQMITSQKGELISCVWCGQQYGRKQLNELREHVDSRHFVASGKADMKDAALTNEIERLGAENEALKAA